MGGWVGGPRAWRVQVRAEDAQHVRALRRRSGGGHLGHGPCSTSTYLVALLCSISVSMCCAALDSAFQRSIAPHVTALRAACVYLCMQHAGAVPCCPCRASVPMHACTQVREAMLRGRDWRAVAEAAKKGHFGEGAARMAKERLEAMVKVGGWGGGWGLGIGGFQGRVQGLGTQ